MVWSFLKQLYELKFWGLLLVLALSNLAGTVGGFDTTGEAGCEDCEQTLLSGISLFPFIIDLLEQGPKVEVVAEIEAEEGASWRVSRKSSSLSEGSDFVVEAAGFSADPTQGKTTTLTFCPANGMFRTQKSLGSLQGPPTSRTIETASLLEKFRVIADPLGETEFVTNNRWLYVRGHNPHVKWLPGASVMSVDIEVTDSPSIQKDAMVVRAGSVGSSLIQVFDSNTEIWTGWTVSVIPPFRQAPLSGISAQISFDANLRALVTVNVVADYFALNAGRSIQDVSFPRLQTTAGRSLGVNVAHSGIEGFVGRLRLRILPPAPAS